MFAPSYFAPNYWAPNYWPPGAEVEEEQYSGGWVYENELPWTLRPVLKQKIRIESDSLPDIEIRPARTPEEISHQVEAFLRRLERTSIPKTRHQDIVRSWQTRESNKRRRKVRLVISDDDLAIVLLTAEL